MTTNHIEKLDPALIRPGRCDVKVEFKRATKRQIRTMFERFYPNSKELAQKFVSEIPDYVVTMAQLQAHFMKYKDEPNAAFENVQSLLDEAHAEKGEEQVPIEEWLRKLGLSHRIHQLKVQQKIRYLADIENINSHFSLKSSFKIDLFGERARILQTLKGNQRLIREMQLAPSKTIERIFMQFYPKASPEMVEKFVKSVPGDTVSILELKTYLYKYEFDVQGAIDNVEQLINPPTKPEIKEPKVLGVKEWLSSIGFEQYAPNFLKHGISDTKLAMKLENRDLSNENLINIKKKGHQIKIMRSIKKLREEFKKYENEIKRYK